MESSSVDNAMPRSVENPVCVRVRRYRPVHLEVEGESIAVGCPLSIEWLLQLHILTIQRGKEGHGMQDLMFHILHRGKQILHPLGLPFLLVDVIWVKDVLVPCL
jgi:hypothetical protein